MPCAPLLGGEATPVRPSKGCAEGRPMLAKPAANPGSYSANLSTAALTTDDT